MHHHNAIDELASNGVIGTNVMLIELVNLETLQKLRAYVNRDAPATRDARCHIRDGEERGRHCLRGFKRDSGAIGRKLAGDVELLFDLVLKHVPTPLLAGIKQVEGATYIFSISPCTKTTFRG